MIALSEAASLGLHGMGLLAASKKRLSAHEMAGILGVSEAHLTKIFQRLVHEGLVDSVRGPGGGFELGRPPEKITLMSIYRAIEGAPREKGELCSCCERCPFTHCLFGTILEDSARSFLNCLAGVTLNTIALRAPEDESQKEPQKEHGIPIISNIPMHA
ncbi:MAG: Rrf2 family transcriptional regulator [Synergistaceae bacterium]|jgi:Rrf2 family protein|nr:Rrf2 family transcriptional regulator [Synergistaceae bacterium]